jgi:hypothetical protein
MIDSVIDSAGMKKKKFKFNFRVIIFSLLCTAFLGAILGMIAAQMSNGEGVAGAAAIVVRVAELASWAVFALIIAYTAFGFLVNWLNRLGDAFKVTEEVDSEVLDISEAMDMFPEYGDIIRDGEVLKSALLEIAQGRQSARARIADAEQLAIMIAGLVRGAVQRAQKVRAEVEALQSAMAAVSKGDDTEIAYQMGMLQDPTLSTLMDTLLIDKAITPKVMQVLAVNVGGMKAQATALMALAETWMSVISESRAELIRAQTTMYELGAASTVISIEASLIQAADSLRLATAEPATVAVAENIPVTPNTPRHMFATNRTDHPDPPRLPIA